MNTDDVHIATTPLSPGINVSAFMHSYIRKSSPDVGDIVMVKYIEYNETSVTVEMLEYVSGSKNLVGMIILSDLSRKRIRRVTQFIRIGSEDVCSIKNADPSRGNFDLTRNNINEAEREYCRDSYESAKKVHKLFIDLSLKTKHNIDYIYENIGWRILDSFAEPTAAVTPAGSANDTSTIASVFRKLGYDIVRSDLTADIALPMIEKTMQELVFKKIYDNYSPKPRIINLFFVCLCATNEGIRLLQRAVKTTRDMIGDNCLLLPLNGTSKVEVRSSPIDDKRGSIYEIRLFSINYPHITDAISEMFKQIQSIIIAGGGRCELLSPVGDDQTIHQQNIISNKHNELGDIDTMDTLAAECDASADSMCAINASEQQDAADAADTSEQPDTTVDAPMEETRAERKKRLKALPRLPKKPNK